MSLICGWDGPDERVKFGGVTEAVRLLCRDGNHTLEDAGEHDLKGVPDRWHLYRVVS